jgi:hypothetical protein
MTYLKIQKRVIPSFKPGDTPPVRYPWLPIYFEGESVKRLQMDIKRKTCDMRIWGKHSFLNISSTNIDTLVSSLYQCAKTRNTEVSWLLSQRFNLFIISETFVTKVAISWPSCEPPCTPHLKQGTVLYKYLLHWSPSPTKTCNRTLFFGNTLLKYGRYFDYRNQPVNMRMRVC